MRMAVLILFAVAATLPVMDAQAAPPDQGMTSAVHKARVGTIVFAPSAVSMKAPATGRFKTRFDWPQMIYGRAFLPHSLAVEYDKQGWKLGRKAYYAFDVLVNGKGVISRTTPLNPSWSTLQVGLRVADKDAKYFPSRTALQRSALYLKPGANVVETSLYAINGNKRRSKVLAKGRITVNFTAQQVKALKTSAMKLSNAIVHRRRDAQGWKWWDVRWGAGTGMLKATYLTVPEAWADYDFAMPWGKGTIKAKWRSGKDRWRDFILEHGGKKVTIATKFRTGKDIFADWVVTSGKETWNVRARWRTGKTITRDWDVTGPGGQKLRITSHWLTDEDAWRNFDIVDNAPRASGPVKLASLFACLLSASLFHPRK